VGSITDLIATLLIPSYKYKGSHHATKHITTAVAEQFSFLANISMGKI
jgi:hypothetical protein